MHPHYRRPLHYLPPIAWAAALVGLTWLVLRAVSIQLSLTALAGIVAAALVTGFLLDPSLYRWISSRAAHRQLPWRAAGGALFRFRAWERGGIINARLTIQNRQPTQLAVPGWGQGRVSGLRLEVKDGGGAVVHRAEYPLAAGAPVLIPGDPIERADRGLPAHPPTLELALDLAPLLHGVAPGRYQLCFSYQPPETGAPEGSSPRLLQLPEPLPLGVFTLTLGQRGIGS